MGTSNLASGLSNSKFRNYDNANWRITRSAALTNTTFGANGTYTVPSNTYALIDRLRIAAAHNGGVFANANAQMEVTLPGGSAQILPFYFLRPANAYGAVQHEWVPHGEMVLPPGTLLRFLSTNGGAALAQVSLSLRLKNSLQALSDGDTRGDPFLAGQGLTVNVGSRQTILAGKAGKCVHIKGIYYSGYINETAAQSLLMEFNSGGTGHPITRFISKYDQQHQLLKNGVSGLNVIGPPGFGVTLNASSANAGTRMSIAIYGEYINESEADVWDWTGRAYNDGANDIQGGNRFWFHTSNTTLALATANYVDFFGPNAPTGSGMLEGYSIFGESSVGGGGVAGFTGGAAALPIPDWAILPTVPNPSYHAFGSNLYGPFKLPSGGGVTPGLCLQYGTGGSVNTQSALGWGRLHSDKKFTVGSAGGAASYVSTHIATI